MSINSKHSNGFCDDKKDIKNITTFKIASYLVKWILKVKPINIEYDNEDTGSCDFVRFIHELWAYHLAFQICDIDINNIEQCTKNRLLMILRDESFSESQFILYLESLKIETELNKKIIELNKKIIELKNKS